MLLFQPNTAQGKLNAVIIPTRPTGFHCSRSVWPGPNMKITLSNSVLSRIGMTNQTGCPMEWGGVTGRSGWVWNFQFYDFLVQFCRFLGGWLDLSRDFLGIQKKKICGLLALISIVLRITYNQICRVLSFNCFLEIFHAQKSGMGFLRGQILVQGFFGVLTPPPPPFDHPRHLKSGLPPGLAIIDTFHVKLCIIKPQYYFAILHIFIKILYQCLQGCH